MRLIWLVLPYAVALPSSLTQKSALAPDEIRSLQNIPGYDHELHLKALDNHVNVHDPKVHAQAKFETDALMEALEAAKSRSDYNEQVEWVVKTMASAWPAADQARFKKCIIDADASCITNFEPDMDAMNKKVLGNYSQNDAEDPIVVADAYRQKLLKDAQDANDEPDAKHIKEIMNGTFTQRSQTFESHSLSIPHDVSTASGAADGMISSVESMLQLDGLNSAAQAGLQQMYNDLTDTGLSAQTIKDYVAWAVYERNNKDKSCWRYYDRGAGHVPNKCYHSKWPKLRMARCYAACPSPAYHESGCCLCRYRGAHSYSAWIGFMMHRRCTSGYMEILGVCWYNRWATGLSGSALDPVRDGQSVWDSNGPKCDKKSRRRQMEAGLCYMDPGEQDPGYGNGRWDCSVTMCRSRASCAAPSVNCGTHEFPRCAPDASACVSDIVNMIVSPIAVIGNIAAVAFSGGTSAAATSAAKAGVKMAQVAAKVAKMSRFAQKAVKAMTKVGNAMARGLSRLEKLRKAKLGQYSKQYDRIQDKVDAATEVTELANEVNEDVNEMYNEFMDMKTACFDGDVLRTQAGNYAADQAKAMFGSTTDKRYVALTMLFMSEMAYIIAKENLADSIDNAISMADPTGIYDVYAAYDAGLCTRNVPMNQAANVKKKHSYGHAHYPHGHNPHSHQPHMHVPHRHHPHNPHIHWPIHFHSPKATNMEQLHRIEAKSTHAKGADVEDGEVAEATGGKFKSCAEVKEAGLCSNAKAQSACQASCPKAEDSAGGSDHPYTKEMCKTACTTFASQKCDAKECNEVTGEVYCKQADTDHCLCKTCLDAYCAEYWKNSPGGDPFCTFN